MKTFRQTQITNKQITYLVYNNNKILINNYKSQIPNHRNHKAWNPQIFLLPNNSLSQGFFVSPNAHPFLLSSIGSSTSYLSGNWLRYGYSLSLSLSLCAIIVALGFVLMMMSSSIFYLFFFFFFLFLVMVLISKGPFGNIVLVTLFVWKTFIMYLFRKTCALLFDCLRHESCHYY